MSFDRTDGLRTEINTSRATGRTEVSNDQLYYRLSIEKAIAEASRLLMRSAGRELDPVLALLGQAVQVDRAYVFRTREQGAILDNTHEWCAPGIEPQIQQLQNLEAAHFAWWMEKLRSGGNLVIPEVSQLPPEAAAEREILQAQCIQSLIVVPIVYSDGSLGGFLGFDDTQRPRDWEVDDGRVLRMAAELIAVNWERAEAQERLYSLVQRLNRACTPREAAAVVLDTAQQMIGWAAAWLVLCDQQAGRLEPVLLYDEVQGESVEVPFEDEALGEDGLPWRCIHEGAFSIERTPEEVVQLAGDPPLFGDQERRSASILCAPILDGAVTVGAISVQSYRFQAYSPADLQTLRSLAEHCAGALKRCQAVAAHSRLLEDRLKLKVERREHEEAFRFAMNAARLGVWDRDLRTELTTWTDYSLLQADGQPLRQLISHSDFLASVHPDDCAMVDRVSNEVIERGGGLNIEFRMTVPDLGERWIRSRGRVVYGPSGEPSHLIGIGEDITENKRLALALQEQKSLLDAVLESLSDAVLAFDPNGALTYRNRVAREKLGVDDRSSYLPNLIDQFEWFHADGIAPMRSDELPFGQPFRGQVVRDVEVVIQLATEERRHLLVSAQPMMSGGATNHGVVITLRDITTARDLEEQFRQSQKMEAVGRLAGGVAHDFNNLLAVMKGYTDLLLMRCDLSSGVRAYLQEVGRAGERAANLTRQLLAFSRKDVVAPRVLDLGATVVDMERMLQRLIGEDVQLVAQVKLHVPVLADPSQIEQILLNLAVNARDAMPTGGRLFIEVTEAVIGEADASANPGLPPGRCASLTVSDTGSGMDRETLRRAFEPFFTTKRPGNGTGLGLSTVYGIIKQWGGQITATSAPGEGTTFQIQFPIAETPPAPDAQGAELYIAPGSETILLVEDEDEVRALVRVVLDHAGYTVLDAPDAITALELAEKWSGSPHLLLSDVVMPQMNGHELAQRLLARWPEMHVLFMSGYTDDAIVRNGVFASEVEFIQKPFSPTDLAHRIRTVLDAPRR